LIKKLPQVIAKDLSKYSAEYDKKLFEELGAKVKIC
jgi:ribosomal protein L7/L12